MKVEFHEIATFVRKYELAIFLLLTKFLGLTTLILFLIRNDVYAFNNINPLCSLETQTPLTATIHLCF